MLHSLLMALVTLPLGSAPNAVLGPGLEAPLMKALRPAEGEVPTGWELLSVEIPQDRVHAVYGPKTEPPPSCDQSPLCVTLRHPSAQGEAAGAFVMQSVGDQIDLARPLIAGIRDRLQRDGPSDPWRSLSAHEPESPSEPSIPPSEAAFRALLASDAELSGRILALTLSPTSARYRIRTDGGPELVIHLAHRPAHLSNPSETTRSFHVRFEGGIVTPPDLPQRALEALQQGDQGALRLSPTSTFEDHSGTWLHEVLWALAALLLLALLASLPALARATLETLGRDRLTWAILLGGILLRLALPSRMIELGIGVMLTDYAEHLIMPRYGPSVPMLHHALFEIFGVDHAIVLNAHRVLGCLMLPLACAGGLRLLGDLRKESPSLAPLWAFGLAFTPMLFRAEATESNLQPALFALWAGLLAWLACRGRARVVGTLAGLGVAMLARPELVLIAPLVWCALCRPWRARGAAPWLVAGLLLCLLPWQLAHVLQRTAWEVGASSLSFDDAFFRYHLWVHLGETALIEPRIAPLMTAVFALVGLVRLRTGRAILWTLGLGGLAWIAVYAVDLSSASAPRLHVAGLQAWTLIAAAALARLVVGHRLALITLSALWLASAAFTLPWLWAETNEDTEARLLERLEESVRSEEGPWRIATLHHVDDPEPQGHGTHRYFPRYRFPPDSVIPLGQIAQEAASATVLYYQGTNCYAALDRDERGGTGLLPACALVHQGLNLDPLWVEEVPNHGNPRFQELGYYGPEPTFEVGVWRVRGR